MRYVAFLRGINVGGHAIIKMEELREVLSLPGIKDVRTYIQSGNVIFDSAEEDETKLMKKLEKKLAEVIGKEIKVLLRSIDELQQLADSAPFKKAKEDKDTKLYVSFLPAVPLQLPKLPYTDTKQNFDVLPVQSREVCYVTRRMPNGSFGNPLVYIEKEFGKVSTSRNWNTIIKILAAYKN